MASPAAARAVQTERGPGRAPVRATPAWAGVAGTPPRPRRPPAPRGPRRLSGPARGNARQLVRRGRHARSLILDLLSALERLSRHRLLERLIRGRSWIGLVAFALIGIVTLQLALLKLNASVGRALEHEASLQRENSALSIENSELASTDHVQARAAQLGMEFASSASLRFLSAHPGADLARAAAAAGSPARSGSGSGAEAASASASPATGGETGSASGGEASATAAGEASSAPSEVSRTQPASSTGGSEQPASEASAGETSSGEAGASQRVAQPQSATSGSGAGASGSSASAEAAPAGGTQASPQG
jgi:cell division protein FtsL